MLYRNSVKRKSVIIMYKLFIIMCVFLCACVGRAHNYIGDEFVGMPYVNSPLGEEVLPDLDPLVRYDAFDCTTFIETVMADGDVEKLNKIRYKDAKIDFLYRNHFIESDWLVNNANLVKNITAEYGNIAQRIVKIDKKNWLKKVHNIDAEFAPIVVKLDYLPYSAFEKINNKNELIVLFVADNPILRDKIGTDLAIVHMGLLLPNGVLRHASSEHGCVIDVDFYEYIRQRTQSKVNLGIILLEMVK